MRHDAEIHLCRSVDIIVTAPESLARGLDCKCKRHIIAVCISSRMVREKAERIAILALKVDPAENHIMFDVIPI